MQPMIIFINLLFVPGNKRTILELLNTCNPGTLSRSHTRKMLSRKYHTIKTNRWTTLNSCCTSRKYETSNMEGKVLIRKHSAFPVFKENIRELVSRAKEN